MFNIYVENMNRSNPRKKFVESFKNKEEAEEALKDRKEKFIYAYDDPHEQEYRSKFNFFIVVE